MEAHIASILGHYPDASVMPYWDVVNEAVSGIYISKKPYIHIHRLFVFQNLLH